MSKKTILREIFYCFTGILVIFFILEIIFPNIILAYVNINVLLLLWLIIGILIIGLNKNSY